MNELIKADNNCTIDDIIKLRQLSYERRKNMNYKEYAADVEKGINEAMELLALVKSSKIG